MIVKHLIGSFTTANTYSYRQIDDAPFHAGRKITDIRRGKNPTSKPWFGTLTLLASCQENGT